MNLRSITHEHGTVPIIDDHGKRQQVPGKTASLVFYPVYHQGNPEHENSKFWAATPGGKLELMVVNAAAVEGLEVGADYYVDIQPAKG